jgi:hypothetical protein
MNKGFITALVLILLVGAGVQWVTNFKARSDFGDRIENSLDSVNDASIRGTAEGLAQEAKKLGITLTADDFEIHFDDTDVQSYAQHLVGSRLGAQFKNKHVSITARYYAHILMIPVREEVSRDKIVQVAAPQLPPNKSAQELLDSN